jgi:hypothetical protein
MKAALLIAFAAAVALAPPQGFLREQDDSLLDFSYGWPAIVEDEPSLRAILAQEMAQSESQARATATEDRNAREPGGNVPFNGHIFAKLWTVAGSTPQLLSLTADHETFTGGAHGGFTYAVLLWDRASDRQVDAADLLGEEALARLTPRHCRALNAERSARRGEPVVPDADDSFTTCPSLADLPLAPTDEDGDGRFDTLAVLIAPYEAGPWAEGTYRIEIPFEATDLAGLAADYRPAFEPADAASPAPAESGERG